MSLKHGLPAGTNSVEDGVCHGFADFKVILTKCKNYLCQLLNVHGVKNVRLTDIYIYIYIYISLCYKSEGRWFDSRWFHWNISLT